MREVVAICRSSKRARVRVAKVLDCYLWRIGDRTWRGRASNACLDRVARELRDKAKRNTAVAIHEIRLARESRVPIIRIGARRAFSPEGLVPVASHAAHASRWPMRLERERHALAILCIAALLHDLGKATRLFQATLRRALNGAKPVGDPVRHELHSAVVWDRLAGTLDDVELIQRLLTLEPEHVDAACTDATGHLRQLHGQPGDPMGLAFAAREGTIAHAIGMLVLTHHRLPDAKADHLTLLPGRHVRPDVPLDDAALAIAEGARFWHDPRWLSRLCRAAGELRPGTGAPGLDLALRASLMFADHIGSALKQPREEAAGHLGNTKDGRPADPLDLHVRRVIERLPGCFDMLHRHRERYPALGEHDVPPGLLHPDPPEPFAWQAHAARAARELCEEREGGFFACLMAATGTGKTRGAPTLLSAASFADARPERRYLRMTLALGLRSLATQSAQDYVDQLGFAAADVAVLIGQPPVRFADDDDAKAAANGSESALALPDWLEVERVSGGVPPEGSEREADWLRRLSHDTDRGLPATMDLAIEHAGARGAAARRLVSAPLLVGTVDHLMSVASPTRARFLFPAVRTLSADLILDEIDQYDPEDIAAIGRLVYQAAAGGRRVIAMSATLTADVASALHAAYCEGWRLHSAASGMANHVNVLCAADAAGSCATNAGSEDFAQVYGVCRAAVLANLETSAPRRRGRILPPCESWEDLVAQIDAACNELHATVATTMDGLRVSIGFVRMTRIRHVAALAVQLPAGPCDGRLRVKLCLHSQFPRLHRAYIERELRRALIRKGPDPDADLRTLCRRERLLEQARVAGCEHLQIVVITSPVVETGNDLDFDWAVIDPSSLRAVVQAAGRVWRHRTYGGAEPNVLILGRSPIVMVEGRLTRPGVETDPHRDTGVERIGRLKDFAGRRFADLAGAETFARIDAGAVLGEGGAVPLREAEAELRARMVWAESEAEPLGRYLRRSTVRLNERMTRSRCFRRPVARDLLYFQDGEEADDAEWLLDLAPGTRSSAPRPAKVLGLQIAADPPEHQLLADLGKSAWTAYLQEAQAATRDDLQRLMRASIPDYAHHNEAEAAPRVTYGVWTGFTRGSPNDLLAPFGKAKP